MGNPPYSVGQKSANDNAQNQNPIQNLTRKLQKLMQNITAT
jgi:predicted helicase